MNAKYRSGERWMTQILPCRTGQSQTLDDVGGFQFLLSQMLPRRHKSVLDQR